MDLQITMDGKSVTEEISVVDCTLDMGLCTASESTIDTASLVLADAQLRWTGWHPETGMKVTISDGTRRLFSGRISSVSQSPGVYVLGLSSGASDRVSVVSRTYDGVSLVDALRDLAKASGQTLKMASKGDIPVDLWVEAEPPQKALAGLCALYDIVAWSDGETIYAMDPESVTSADVNIDILEDDSYGLSRGSRPKAVEVLTAKARGYAEEGDGVGKVSVNLRSGLDEKGLKGLAERHLRRLRRTEGFSLRKDLDGEVYRPGLVVDLGTPGEKDEGWYLVTGCRVRVAKGVQDLRGVRLK